MNRQLTQDVHKRPCCQVNRGESAYPGLRGRSCDPRGWAFVLILLPDSGVWVPSSGGSACSCGLSAPLCPFLLCPPKSLPCDHPLQPSLSQSGFTFNRHLLNLPPLNLGGNVGIKPDYRCYRRARLGAPEREWLELAPAPPGLTQLPRGGSRLWTPLPGPAGPPRGLCLHPSRDAGGMLMGSLKKMSSSFKRGSLKSSTSGSQKVSEPEGSLRAGGPQDGGCGFPAVPLCSAHRGWGWGPTSKALASEPLLGRGPHTSRHCTRHPHPLGLPHLAHAPHGTRGGAGSVSRASVESHTVMLPP